MNNVYNSVSVSPNTPTVIASLTVPERGGYSFKGVIIWSEIDCDVTVSINVATVGGGRISGSTQTLFLDYSASPYGVGERDVITVIATQTGSGAHPVSCTMLMEQL